MQAVSYAISKRSALSFDDADKQVRDELQKEGFGVLTEIDVQATMKKKLDLDMARYLILGACNPSLASNALQNEPDVGLLLPCNVVVREDQDGVVVEILDPVQQFGISGNTTLEPLAHEARERLQRALSRLR